MNITETKINAISNGGEIVPAHENPDGSVSIGAGVTSTPQPLATPIRSAPRPNYRLYDRTGGGVTHDIYAESLDDAIQQGRAWIEDGDWSGGENGERVYRTIRLDCAVGEIVYAPDLRSIEALPGVYDVTPVEGKRITMSVDAESLPVLVGGGGPLQGVIRVLSGDVVEEDGSQTIAAEIIHHLPMMIDEEATADADKHDCSGQYSDELPDCEVGSQVDADKLPDADVDSTGHEWVSTTEMGDEFGCRSHGGTAMIHYEVCRLCGQYKVTQTPGCQRNPDEPLETITIKDRDEKSEAWLKETHEQDGFIPAWLAEMLGCSVSNRRENNKSAYQP